jgi:hypothetical protein
MRGRAIVTRPQQGGVGVVNALALARRNHSVRSNPEAASDAEGLGFERSANSLQIPPFRRAASQISKTVCQRFAVAQKY